MALVKRAVDAGLVLERESGPPAKKEYRCCPSTPEDLEVDALVDELTHSAGEMSARWYIDASKSGTGTPHHGYAAAEARAALDAVPHAREWLQCFWLEGGDLMSPADEEFNEAESRRYMVGAALSWNVSLHRRAVGKAKGARWSEIPS